MGCHMGHLRIRKMCFTCAECLLLCVCFMFYVQCITPVQAKREEHIGTGSNSRFFLSGYNQTKK